MAAMPQVLIRRGLRRVIATGWAGAAAIQEMADAS